MPTTTSVEVRELRQSQRALVAASLLACPAGPKRVKRA
jgi:hypothetical protein